LIASIDIYKKYIVIVTKDKRCVFMRSTKSLCPECLAVIDASIIEENGKMILEKTCRKHGYFKDIYWSDPVQFKRF